MKLIDILVNGLPKIGGWPECVSALVQNSKGLIYPAGGGFGVMQEALSDDWQLAEITKEQYESALAATKEPTVKQWKYIKGSENDFTPNTAMATVAARSLKTGKLAFFVSLEQFHHNAMTEIHPYEIIALREQISEWGGVGLPPVGEFCEWRDDCGAEPVWYKAYFRGAVETTTGEMVVIETVTPESEPHGCALEFRGTHARFRPIKSEADKKRDAAVGQMERGWEDVTKVPAVKFEVIYDLIASGKIPGVKLED